MEATQSKQIYLAMAAIITDISAISKDRENTIQHFKFRGIDDVYNALHPIFAAHGVVCIPMVSTVTHTDAGVTAKGNVQTRAVVEMGYSFVASDGSFIDARMVGEGVDSADKATAKALSAAHKYLLLQTFLIPTADLEDSDQYDPTVFPKEQLARIVSTREREDMQNTIDQLLAQAANAEGDEKHRLQGIAAELRCKLADLDLEASKRRITETIDKEITKLDWKGYKLTQLGKSEINGRLLGELPPATIKILHAKRGLPYLDSEDALLRNEALHIDAAFKEVA